MSVSREGRRGEAITHDRRLIRGTTVGLVTNLGLTEGQRLLQTLHWVRLHTSRPSRLYLLSYIELHRTSSREHHFTTNQPKDFHFSLL